MHAAVSVIFISIGITCVRSHPGYWSTPSLSPVHGLYVKRSSDGVSGDLYVAASEDNGVKSQWLVEQPVNFLQVAATQPHATALTLPYPGFPTSQEESSTKKRAVMPSQAPSPPVQYAYALPVQSSESSQVVAYPYTYPSPSTPTDTPKCESSSTTSHYPFQFPFQFFYPQMMSAYTNAMSILKDAGFSEDSASTVMAQASPMWSPSSYAYPMYLMAMPSPCTQNQAATTPSTSTSSPTTQEEEKAQA